MRKTKKLISLILAIILAAGFLSGCAPDEKPQGEDVTETEMPQLQTTGEVQYVYVPEYVTLNADISDMRNISYHDDMVYFTSYAMLGQRTATISAEMAEQAFASGELEAANATQAVGQSADDETSETDETTETDESEEAEVGTEESGSGSLVKNPDGTYSYSYDEYGMAIFRMKIDGSGFERLPGYVPASLPEDEQGNTDIAAFCASPDGTLLVVERINRYTIENDRYTSQGTELYLKKLNPDGTEISVTDISDMAEGVEYAYVSSMMSDKDGNVVIAAGDAGIFVYSAEGELLFNIDNNSWVDRFSRLSDGSVGAIIYDNSRTFKTIDINAKDWVNFGAELPYNANTVYSGSGDYSFYYRDSLNFYGYDAEKKESVKLLNWTDCDIVPDSVNEIIVLPDGKILCLTYTYGEFESKLELAVLTERDASTIEEKTALTLALLYADSTITSSVVNFNKKNSQCRISIKDYSEYNTEDDGMLGMMKLSNDIIAGNVPDLIAVNNLPINRYIAKGLLEDLYPYIDSDPELSRDDLMMDYFSALERNGALYYASSGFSISTVFGRSDVVGSEIGWTLDELLEVMKTLPEGTRVFPNLDRNSVMNSLCALDMDSFVNWETGECSFNSEEFIKILEFAMMFPEPYNYEDPNWQDNYVSDVKQLQEGQAIMQHYNISSFEIMQMFKAMLGGEITFKGFPVLNGNGNAFADYGGIAMSTKCADKESAWSFMRTMLSEEYQDSNSRWNFPTNKHSFEKQLEKKMQKETRIENGEEVEVSYSSWGWDDLMVNIYATTPEERDQILDLIAKTERVMNYDTDMWNIISEETESYFAGQKSAQETANIIQSRINIYVNEQR